jgi:hypothetical protein
VSKGLKRIVLVGRNIELRIVSLVVRCREVADEVLLFDSGSNDETVELADEIQCEVVHLNGVLSPQNLCTTLIQQGHDAGTTLFLPISNAWKLSELPLSVNRARENWDVHYVFQDSGPSREVDETVIAETTIRHLIVNSDGCQALAELPDEAKSSALDDRLKVRFVLADQPIQLPQRESLATASRFAQLFYWMLESKHPLLLFGIPGVVLFVLGYRLSGDLATMFTELNSTSIGVTLVTIAMTLIGLFAMMVALILYIMGKQVARIQHQYNWPKDSA